MKINYKSFILSIKVQEPLILPHYKGSTFRGGFGNVFKKIVCALKKRDCRDCVLKDKCIYCYIFETPPPSDTKIMRKYTTAPHPFIIEPPVEKKTIYKPHEEMQFGLALIGKAIDYLSYFIYTFDELGKIGIGKGRGKFALKTVTSHEAEVNSEEQIIYSSDTKTIKSLSPSYLSPIFNDLDSKTFNFKLLTLNFLTPTRIIYDSHLTVDLEFHILIRQLLRRISLLSYFHCGADISDWNFKEIIEKARDVKVKESNLKWHDWERYSARQDTKMKMGGFIGEITFEGNIEPFIPLINAGEILHVGKGTSFGLGKYQIAHIS